MHRQAIKQLLTEYGTRYPEESETTDRYQQFVSAHEDCFERSQLAGHITGSAWLLNRADGDTSPLAVAIREAREESGIASITALSDTLFDIDIHQIPQRKSEPAHYHYDARFLLQTTVTDNFIVSDESHALEWVEITKIESRTTEPSMLRMTRKYIDTLPI